MVVIKPSPLMSPISLIDAANTTSSSDTDTVSSGHPPSAASAAVTAHRRHINVGCLQEILAATVHSFEIRGGRTVKSVGKRNVSAILSTIIFVSTQLRPIVLGYNAKRASFPI